MTERPSVEDHHPERSHIEPLIPRVRKPVTRDIAPQYLLYTLLSFAISVSLTRLFLNLTGYPQLGGGELHIAHVLWGGLLLFIASLIPILYVNRWAYLVDAVLSGVGVGLFIDEVGKFITRSNDYFYPAAAPIIYAFFLLTVLLYLEIRRPHRTDARAQLYAVLEELEEVLDQDLSDRERQRLLSRLNGIESSTTSPDLVRLVEELRDFVTCDTLYLVPHKPGPVERTRAYFEQLADRRISQRRYQIALAGLLTAVGVWSLRLPVLIILYLDDYSSLQGIISNLVQSGLVHSRTALEWFEIRLGLQVAIAMLLLIGAVLYIVRRDHQATAIGYLGLLLSLTMLNLLAFYFEQFSTIIEASLQFLVLLAIIYYRRRYLRNRLL